MVGFAKGAEVAKASKVAEVAKASRIAEVGKIFFAAKGIRSV